MGPFSVDKNTLPVILKELKDLDVMAWVALPIATTNRPSATRCPLNTFAFVTTGSGAVPASVPRPWIATYATTSYCPARNAYPRGSTSPSTYTEMLTWLPKLTATEPNRQF
jgi:hypothetical protein